MTQMLAMVIKFTQNRSWSFGKETTAVMVMVRLTRSCRRWLPSPCYCPEAGVMPMCTGGRKRAVAGGVGGGPLLSANHSICSPLRRVSTFALLTFTGNRAVEKQIPFQASALSENKSKPDKAYEYAVTKCSERDLKPSDQPHFGPNSNREWKAQEKMSTSSNVSNITILVSNKEVSQVTVLLS